MGGQVVDGAADGIDEGAGFLGVELEREVVVDAQLHERLEVHPQADRVAPGGPVRSAGAAVGLEERDAAGLGSAQGVHRVVGLQLALGRRQAEGVARGAGEQEDVPAADGRAELDLHLAVGERGHRERAAEVGRLGGEIPQRRGHRVAVGRQRAGGNQEQPAAHDTDSTDRSRRGQAPGRRRARVRPPPSRARGGRRRARARGSRAIPSDPSPPGRREGGRRPADPGSRPPASSRSTSRSTVAEQVGEPARQQGDETDDRRAELRIGECGEPRGGGEEVLPDSARPGRRAAPGPIDRGKADSSSTRMRCSDSAGREVCRSRKSSRYAPMKGSSRSPTAFRISRRSSSVAPSSVSRMTGVVRPVGGESELAPERAGGRRCGEQGEEDEEGPCRARRSAPRGRRSAAQSGHPHGSRYTYRHIGSGVTDAGTSALLQRRAERRQAAWHSGPLKGRTPGRGEGHQWRRRKRHPRSSRR